jgi:hypothetical protein
MPSRRWPDLVIALAVLGLAALGLWALWGDDVDPGRRPAPPGAASAAQGGTAT